MKSHLFIVDDDANTLASLSRAFRLAGHEATVCDNPVKALDIIRQEKFDLIFSDVMMPVKDGLQLLEEVQKRRLPADVIITTGFGTGNATFALAQGADAYEPKPINPESFLATVARLLE